MLVLSCVLVVTFLAWAFLSMPSYEMEDIPVSAYDMEAALFDDRVTIVIRCAVAILGGVVFSCALDSDHALSHGLIQLL